MITVSRLAEAFYPVDELSDGIVRCGDELPNKTFYTYFKICENDQYSPFIVSENCIDDDFAGEILQFCGCRSAVDFAKCQLSENRYGFTHLLYVPYQYHSELKGRLDSDRMNTILCIPIFNSEFSGDESPEEFIELRRTIVPTYRWDRDVSPKITFRFDNRKTKGGTGDGYVFARFDQVLREIDNLVGVTDGFIELINYKDDVVEILFHGGSVFTWIQNRNDSRAEQITQDSIHDRLWTFLTR